MNVETFRYDNRIVRAFAIATVVWGIVGMSAGLLAAVQLFYPGANLNLQYVTFGRLRPLYEFRVRQDPWQLELNLHHELWSGRGERTLFVVQPDGQLGEQIARVDVWRERPVVGGALHHERAAGVDHQEALHASLVAGALRQTRLLSQSSPRSGSKKLRNAIVLRG